MGLELNQTNSKGKIVPGRGVITQSPERKKYKDESVEQAGLKYKNK